MISHVLTLTWRTDKVGNKWQASEFLVYYSLSEANKKLMCFRDNSNLYLLNINEVTLAGFGVLFDEITFL